jgi:hypothetical protein
MNEIGIVLFEVDVDIHDPISIVGQSRGVLIERKFFACRLANGTQVHYCRGPASCSQGAST